MPYGPRLLRLGAMLRSSSLCATPKKASASSSDRRQSVASGVTPGGFYTGKSKENTCHGLLSPTQMKHIKSLSHSDNNFLFNKRCSKSWKIGRASGILAPLHGHAAMFFLELNGLSTVAGFSPGVGTADRPKVQSSAGSLAHPHPGA